MMDNLDNHWFGRQFSIMRAEDKSLDASNVQEDQDLFEMANLYPKHTGLPVTVWVSPKGHARYAARLKVSSTPGNRMDLDGTAVVELQPTPRLIKGTLPSKTLEDVLRWTALNQTALIDYWEGAIDTIEFVERLRKL